MTTELCERIKNILPPQQVEALDALSDEELKCLGAYGNFLRGKSTRSHALLLKLLESVAETDIESAGSDGHSHVLKTAQWRGIADRHQDANYNSKRAGISTEICGNGKICTDPAALQVSQALQKQLAGLTLKDLQVPVDILKKALEPCTFLRDLRLENVVLRPPCERLQDGASAPRALMLPSLQSFHFRSDSPEAVNCSLDTIICFGVGEKRATLSELWKRQMDVNVQTEAISLQMCAKTGSVYLQVHRKEFFDAPNFVPYVSATEVFEFLEEFHGVSSLTLMLPDGFATVDFVKLPKDIKRICCSGLEIQCPQDIICTKLYNDIKLVKCSLSQFFLDNLYSFLPRANLIELEGCTVGSSQLVNFTVTFDG